MVWTLLDIAPAKQKLLYGRQRLEDSQTLRHYGLCHLETVTLVLS